MLSNYPAGVTDATIDEHFGDKDACLRCDGEGRIYCAVHDTMNLCPRCEGTGVEPERNDDEARD